MRAPWWRLAAVFVAFGTLPAVPHAQIYNTSAAMPVRIEIAASCTVSAVDLNFGNYASNSPAPVQGLTTIQLRCGSGVTAEVGLDAGSGAGASTTNRRMEADAGSGRLDYELYQDAARTIHWGDRSGRDTLEVQVTDASLTVTVYGKIPAGQRALEGTYSDTITVQVFY